MKVSSKQDRSQKAPRVSWTPDLIDAVRAMASDNTLMDIATKLGLTYRQVDSIMLHNGIFRQRKFIALRDGISELHKWKETEFAHFSGIVDGEGTITVQRTKARNNGASNGNVYYRPHIIISTTSLHLVDWLEARQFYGALARNNNGRGYWKCAVSGYSLDELLMRMLPFLTIKRRHAELLIAFIQERKRLGHRFTPTPEMDRLYREIKALNVRGSKLFEEYEAEHRARYMTSSRHVTASSPTA